MKRRKIFLFVALTGFLSIRVFGQLADIGNFMAGGPSDAQKLFQAYLEPFGNALGANLSAGWYTSAKAHNLLGFDLTATTSVAFVPDAAKTFDMMALGLSGIPGTPSIAPTFSGERKSGPSLAYSANIGGTDYEVARYNSPKGLGVGFIPAPMFKLGLGLIKGTEIMGRYVPTLKLGRFGDFGLWGVGLKHELTQYIPFVKRVPFLNLSLMGGYTSMSTGANLSVNPGTLNATDNSGGVSWTKQRMDMGVTNWNVNLLISADIPVVTFYAGAGISSSKTSLKLKGNFPTPMHWDLANNKPAVGVGDFIADGAFPEISIGGKDGTITKPRVNVGMKFKMAIIHLSFDYTYANYSIATTGLGISFR